MTILVDILIIAFIGAFAFVGSRRSVLSTIVSVAITAVSCALALLVAKPASTAAYEKYIKPKVVDTIADSMDSADLKENFDKAKDQLADSLKIEIEDSELKELAESDDLFASIQQLAADKGENISKDEIKARIDENVTPEKIEEYTDGNIKDDDAKQLADTLTDEESIKNIIGVVAEDDPQKAAENLESGIIRDKAIDISRAGAVLVVFLLASVLLRVVYRVLRILKVIRVTKKFSHLVGALIGAAEGVLILFIIGFAVRYAVNHSFGVLDFVMTDFINKTFLANIFV